METNDSPKKQLSIGKKISFTLIILIVFLILFGLLGEIILRIIEKPQAYSDRTEVDKSVGWMPKPNLNLEYNIQDSKGNQRNVIYKTEEFGFRNFGNINSDKIKLLFVGDSYTQAVEVSNDKTFFNIIGDSLNVEIFAFGQAGYGSIQQSMIIEKYVDKIKPSLIILQTCDNDFIDNQAELEHNSNYQVGLRRPYLDENDKLYYANPKDHTLGIAQHSKFISLILNKIKYGVVNKIVEPSEKLIAEQKEQFKPYQQAKESTKFALKRMLKVIGDTPIILFSASSFEPQLSDFKLIANDLGISFYESPAKSIDAHKYQQTLTSIDKYHWVDEGHEMIAEELIPIIKKHLSAQ